MKKEEILENHEKVARATNIIALVSGKATPKSGFEQERKDKWTRVCAEKKIDVKGETALKEIYLILGGRIITHEEAKKIEVKKEAIKAGTVKKNA